MTSLKRPNIDLDDGRPATKRRIDDTDDATLLIATADSTAPPPLQQPYQLLSFSYTSHPSPRTLEWSNASLKYFVPPPRAADLAYGYGRWIKRPEERARLDGLLEACVRDECEAERERAAIVSWRGVITKILTAPYEDRDGWDLNVMHVSGTMYLEEHLSEDKLREKSNLAGQHRLMTYYGYAFESYCTADDARGGGRDKNGWGGDVDTNVQWCSVVKTKLGSTRMILGGEVDCVRDQYTGQPDTFVELKTSMAIRPGNAGDEAKFEKKLLKYYIQSFLLGVPEIVVGFRTPSGRLQTLQTFRTRDIPRLGRDRGRWDAGACLAWGARTFAFLARQCRVHVEGDERGGEGDTARTVWRVTFRPGVGLSVRKLDAGDVEDVRGGEDRVGFLPRWYWERVRGDSGVASKGKQGEEMAQELHADDNGASAGETSAQGTRAGCTIQGWQL